MRDRVESEGSEKKERDREKIERMKGEKRN